MITVVTGAAGHLGGNLVRGLLAQGRQVRALDLTRDWQPLDGLAVERVGGDIRHLESLRRAFAGAEVVYHTAAYISLQMDDWPLVESINVAGVGNVVRACLDCGVRRLVHFSSVHALKQEPLELPVDEASPLVPPHSQHPPYDRSKAAGEAEVRRGIEQGLDAIIVNPTGMIGPHDCRPSYFGRVLLALGRGELPGLVNAGFDWVDVRDVVAGALAAEGRAPAGARYLLSGHWVSLRAVAAVVQEITGAHPPRLVAPLWLAHVAAAMARPLARRRGAPPLLTEASLLALRSNRRISHERAARDLDYHPRPFRETLHDTFRWFRQAGLLAPASG